MNYETHQELKQAAAKFIEEYKDHPLLKDTVATLRDAMYDLDTMLMTPGQKAAREAYIRPTGQEPTGQQPVHQ